MKFALVLLATAAIALCEPTNYNVVACNRPGQPVCIDDGYTAPPSVLNYYETSVLTEAMFNAFFTGPNYTPNSWNWTVTDVNNSGVAIGTVFGANFGGSHSSFVYYDGGILCCNDDDAYDLTDVNNNGLITVAGFGPAYGPSNFGSWLSYCCSGPSGFVFVVPATFSNASNFFPGHGTRFLSVDDNNIVFADGFGLDGNGYQQYNLFPVSTPEPSPFSLFATAVGFVALRQHRARRQGHRIARA